MSILFELRYPTKWYTKLLTAILALIFFAVLATLAIAGFLVYRIVKPNRTSSEINLQSFPADRTRWSLMFPGQPGIAKAGSSRDCAARRRLSCATAMARAAANC